MAACSAGAQVEDAREQGALQVKAYESARNGWGQPSAWAFWKSLTRRSRPRELWEGVGVMASSASWLWQRLRSSLRWSPPQNCMPKSEFLLYVNFKIKFQNATKTTSQKGDKYTLTVKHLGNRNIMLSTKDHLRSWILMYQSTKSLLIWFQDTTLEITFKKLPCYKAWCSDRKEYRYK